MVELIKDIVKWLTNKQVKASKRVSLILLCIFGILATDYLYGFSEFYVNQRKIDQVSHIQQLLDKQTLDSTTAAKLKNMQSKILFRKNYSEWFSDLYSLIQSNINSASKTTTIKTNDNPIENNNKTVKKRSAIWHTVSSGWLLIIFMAVFPLSIFSGNIGAAELVGVFAAEIAMAILVSLFAYIFSYLPNYKYPIINYLLNATLHFLVIAVIAKFSGQTQNKK